MTPPGNAWVSIQSFVLRRCASTSSSGFPVNSGLKWDQFHCGIGPGCTGRAAGCTGGTAGCVGDAGGCKGAAGSTAGSEGDGCGADDPPSAIFILCYMVKKIA